MFNNTAELVSFIRECERENKLYKFYKTKEWQQLRRRTLEKEHGECVRCRDRGIYSRAETVHHVNEVLKHPELALSEFFTDAQGNTHRNLIPLCHACHDEVHNRMGFSPAKVPLTPERWE